MFGKHTPKNQGLYIIIVGCGKVGTTLVEQLIKEGHDITIIDRSPSKIEELTNLYDIMGVVGNGASYSVQRDAGIENADLIIAVTESDELNLLCCTVAKQVANCAAIARVRTPDYSREAGYLKEKLGLAMIINPELEAAREAARILYMPTALGVNSFAHGQAELIKFKIPDENILDQMT
ncbi:MAG: NAD-binding protein, partial [Lachnospiraceae bacterium]|nr:NAD-binding protein [Lachnospiraceae bacterium]